MSVVVVVAVSGSSTGSSSIIIFHSSCYDTGLRYLEIDIPHNAEEPRYVAHHVFLTYLRIRLFMASLFFRILTTALPFPSDILPQQ